MDVMNSPDMSVVEPQSVPSRISVELVEEAKVGGAHRVECPRVDQDLRLLATCGSGSTVVIYCQVLRRCCLLPTLPGSYFRLLARMG